MFIPLKDENPAGGIYFGILVPDAAFECGGWRRSGLVRSHRRVSGRNDAARLDFREKTESLDVRERLQINLTYLVGLCIFLYSYNYILLSYKPAVWF